jgi:hypothetical protein
MRRGTICIPRHAWINGLYLNMFMSNVPNGAVARLWLLISNIGGRISNAMTPVTSKYSWFVSFAQRKCHTIRSIPVSFHILSNSSFAITQHQSKLHNLCSWKASLNSPRITQSSIPNFFSFQVHTVRQTRMHYGRICTFVIEVAWKVSWSLLRKSTLGGRKKVGSTAAGLQESQPVSLPPPPNTHTHARTHL